MMTNEEAIKYIIRHCNPDYPKGKTEWETAINMAINALKAQLSSCSGIPNSSDLISRQAAIDAVHEEFDDCPVWDESGEYTADEVEQTLDRVPSAQPEQHWIPCGERLPDTNRDVLLQFDINMGVGFWENGEWGVNTGDNIYSEIGEGEAKPIAWMPLPEPYREDE